jgi:ABC-type Fe3+/spermidine/putrescine transport system ATPase subunit
MLKAEMATRIQQTLAMLAMEDFGERPVTQLSGGQQQRVALARALAVQPDILLLDEPLSNLDAQLRRSTRHELKGLQRRLGITTIYVTHDQEEAMALSDRLLVMNQGRAQQIGAPEEIYFSPANLFVMDFIGRSNVLTGRVVEWSENALGLAGEGWKIFSDNFDKKADWQIGAPAQIAFRPQDAVLRSAGQGVNEIAGRLRFIEFRGDFWEAELVIGDRPCLIHLSADEARVLRSRLAASDDRLWLHVPPAKVFVFAA